MAQFKNGLCWFRRDLRADDHAALHHALTRSARVYCVFVFDRGILEPLRRDDRRVSFIWDSVRILRDDLMKRGGDLIVCSGRAADEIVSLVDRLHIDALFYNRDYEPQAIARDAAVEQAMRARSVATYAHKDQVIFERSEIVTRAGTPYTVFTPYRKAWLAKLDAEGLPAYPTDIGTLAAPGDRALPSLAMLGFVRGDYRPYGAEPGRPGAVEQLEQFGSRLDEYDASRDYPARDTTSRLAVHLRFGTLSVREVVRAARAHAGKGAETWLSELVWRDFFQMVLALNPHVTQHAFRPEYDDLRWDDDDAAFRAWCEGRTGYPLVDAAMRQLNATGFMHNRLRMVTASFLTKDLHIDWRRGERYFAEQLLDYDLAANNGGWQWAASTGCDAQPYFRIFNPVSQSRRFDPDASFIRAWVPELARLGDRDIHAPWLATPAALEAANLRLPRDYPLPLVNHEVARKETLQRYKAAAKR